MFKKIAIGVAGLLLTAKLCGCATPEINHGYSALETAATSKSDVRSRILVNEDLTAGNFRAGYHGLNDIDNCDAATYYGRHVLTAGTDSIQGAAVLKTGNSGITDAKYGIRFCVFDRLGGYGFADISAERDAANLSVFYGRPIGKTSVEVYEAAEFPFDGDPTSYTEFQVNRNFGKRLSAFSRVETTEFDAESTRYLLGLTISF